MRRAINIFTLLFFIWLVVDALNIPSHLLNFLLAGIVPYTSITLSPTFMLGILTGTMIIFVYETVIRRSQLLRAIRESRVPIATNQKKSPTI